MVWFELISHMLLIAALGFYLITNLQLYGYRLNRVIFHHSKPRWHLLYFVLPIFVYYLTDSFFWIYFYFGLLPVLFLWHKRIDKKLVFTDRVKRFFAILAVLTVFQDFLCLATQSCALYGIVLPLLGAYIGSQAVEALLFGAYKRRAQKKLAKHNDMIIVGITASYGKTSIKNFLYEFLKDDFKAYKTPKSVNTLAGIVKDINCDLPADTEVYIVEMGARQRGDIEAITKLLQPQYALVGKIGPAHIEYFKTLENIRDTKLELIHSKRLKKAFVDASAHINPSGNVVSFSPVLHTKATLEGITFVYEGQTYNAPILGAFNAGNIALGLAMAQELGAKDLVSKTSGLQPVAHRLQKIEAGGKLIIDDSYNGNAEGMIESFALVKTYNGRKVLVTAGLVEADTALNEKVAKAADGVFDLIVVTSQLNYKIFCDTIEISSLERLADKAKMQEFLAANTRPGDLILFANDAPNFV